MYKVRSKTNLIQGRDIISKQQKIIEVIIMLGDISNADHIYCCWIHRYEKRNKWPDDYS